MAIIRPKAPVPTPIDPVQVKIVDEGYRGVTVDSQSTPLANIIQYVEGSVWEVEYYSQVLARDSEAQPHQLERAAAFQQYAKIMGLELKVTEPITTSTDQESGGSVAQGSAYIPTDIIPSKGDTFLADIGQGREAQWTVTSVERKTHFKQSVYLISYEAVGYSDHDVSAIRQDLAVKVVKTAHFVRDHHHLGANPLVLSDDFNHRIEIQKLYRDLARHYFADFYSHGFRTLLIPDQASPAYDPFLTMEVMKWVDQEDAPELLHIQRPRVTTAFGRVPDTVWSALSAMDYGHLGLAVHRMGLVNRLCFRGQPDLGGFFYAGITFCMYPSENRTDVDAGYSVRAAPQGHNAMRASKMRHHDLSRLKPVAELNGLHYQSRDTAAKKLPLIAPVQLSGYYVFSENFYTGQGPLASELERLIYQGLKHDTLERGLLIEVAKTAMQWDNLERFYYIPALLALLRTALRIN